MNRYIKFVILFLALVGGSGFATISFSQGKKALTPLKETQTPPSFWPQQGWQTDFSRSTISFIEVTDVIGRDNIPSIDSPVFTEAVKDQTIPRNEPVIALEINGDARAYPLRIMMWHEIVNDRVGDVPVAVTYCPLCNTSIVFDRRLEGKEVTFGTTGKLRNSDLIMYDRTSQSWWQQFDGSGIVGKFAGDKLKSYPSRLMSFELFLNEYPRGQLLAPDPRRIAQLGRNPYRDYDSLTNPFLFRGELPQDINAMVRVVLVQGESPFAVALPKLIETGEFTHNDIRFSWKAGQASALDTSVIAEGRDVGNIEVRDGDGNLVVHEITFAFAARAFLPDLQIIQ